MLDLTEDLNSKAFSEKFAVFVTEIAQTFDPSIEVPDVEEAGFIIDAADVAVLRDFLEGNFNNEEYLERLEKLYE